MTEMIEFVGGPRDREQMSWDGGNQIEVVERGPWVGKLTDIQTAPYSERIHTYRRAGAYPRFFEYHGFREVDYAVTPETINATVTIKPAGDA